MPTPRSSVVNELNGTFVRVPMDTTSSHHRAFVMYAVLYFNDYFPDSASFFRTPLSQFDTTTSFASALLRLGNMIRLPSADT